MGGGPPKLLSVSARRAIGDRSTRGEARGAKSAAAESNWSHTRRSGRSHDAVLLFATEISDQIKSLYDGFENERSSGSRRALKSRRTEAMPRLPDGPPVTASAGIGPPPRLREIPS